MSWWSSYKAVCRRNVWYQTSLLQPRRVGGWLDSSVDVADCRAKNGREFRPQCSSAISSKSCTAWLARWPVRRGRKCSWWQLEKSLRGGFSEVPASKYYTCTVRIPVVCVAILNHNADQSANDQHSPQLTYFDFRIITQKIALNAVLVMKLLYNVD